LGGGELKFAGALKRTPPFQTQAGRFLLLLGRDIGIAVKDKPRSRPKAAQAQMWRMLQHAAAGFSRQSRTLR